MFSRVVRRGRALVLVPLTAAGLLVSGCAHISAHGMMPTGGMYSYCFGCGEFGSGQATFSFDLPTTGNLRGWWADSGWGTVNDPIAFVDPALQQAVGSSLQLSFNGGTTDLCGIGSGLASPSECISRTLASCPVIGHATCVADTNAIATGSLLPSGNTSSESFAFSAFNYSSQNPNWPGSGQGILLASGDAGTRTGPGAIFVLIFSGPYAGYLDENETTGGVFKVY